MKNKKASSDNSNNPKIITRALTMTTPCSSSMKDKRSMPNITDQRAMTDCTFLTENKVCSRIDYLTIQFAPRNMIEFENIAKQIMNWLLKIGISSNDGEPNLKYFDQGHFLKSLDQTNAHCGAIKWNNSCDKFQLELSGLGCQYVNTYSDYFFKLKEISETIGTSIKRLDIAVDTYKPRHSLRFIQQSYSKGLYNSKTGRKPKRENISSGSGKSIILGSRHSFKQFIGYEKGKAEGFNRHSFLYSNWFRHELRLRSRQGQPIPLKALFKPDDYFVGAYPKAHRRLIKNATPRVIKREVMTAIDNTLMFKLAYAKRQVGKTLYWAVERGVGPVRLVNMLKREGSGKNNNLAYPSYITKQDLKNNHFD
jgi:DNA relaxase NicK